MNKEEILAKSRQENKEQDLFLLQINEKSWSIGSTCAWIYCIILFALSGFLTGALNYGFFSIIMVMKAGSYIYRAIKTKSKVLLCYGMIYILLTLFATVLWIRNCGV